MIRIPTSKMPNLFVDVCQDLVYAYGWPSRLVRLIWKVKRAPKRAYPSFRRFLCAIAHHFWVIRISMSKNAKFFCGRPSRCHHGLYNPFGGQTSPEASIPLISTIFVCYSTPFLGDPDSDVKNVKIYVDVLQNLGYASGFPSRTI